MKRKLTALTLGLLITLVALELGLRVGYGTFVRAQARANLAALGDGEGVVRVLCIGESTTAVAGDPEGRLLLPGNSYPAQLEAILADRPTEHRYQVSNNGMMGGTSTASLALLEDSLPALRPHVIVAMMGIKDTPDERLPGLAGLPGWLASLRSAQLVAWLVEAVQLRVAGVDLEVDTVAEIPSSRKAMSGPLRNYAYEPRLLDLPPGERAQVEEKLRLALYYWYVGRLGDAEALLREAVLDHDLGHNLLARVQRSAGKATQARETLELAMALHPDDAFYPLVLAQQLLEDDEPEAATSILLEVMENPEGYRQRQVWEAHLQVTLGQAWSRQGERQRALAVLERMRGPERGGRYDQALPPITFQRHLALGQAYLEAGAFERAEEHLTRAIERWPKRHVAMHLLSEVYSQQGRFEEEESLRRELLQGSERLAEYFELAKLYRREGHPERAREVVAGGVERIPSLRQSYRRLYALTQREGIHLVVMQYPSFSLDLLHRYAPPAPGVSFIDNEHLFDADPMGYLHAPEYPHSFTHYTYDGARLMAERVADHLLMELEPDSVPGETKP